MDGQLGLFGDEPAPQIDLFGNETKLATVRHKPNRNPELVVLEAVEIARAALETAAQEVLSIKARESYSGWHHSLQTVFLDCDRQVKDLVRIARNLRRVFKDRHQERATGR